MRRKALALSLMTVLLVALVSGCISESKAPTGTVSKAPVQKQSSGTPSSETTTHTGTSTTPVQSTSSTGAVHSTKWEPVPKPKTCDNWRDDFEKAIYCALTSTTIEKLGQMIHEIAPQATTPSEKTYYILSYGTVNLAVDDVKENKSMSIGHYYDIKTPLETLNSKGGSRADIALLYAGFFLNIYNTTYLYYAIQNSTAFDVEAGFYYAGINYTTLWPYPFPLPYTQYERMAAMHAGYDIHTLVLYRITKQPNGDISVEKRYVPIREREKWDIALSNSGMLLNSENLKELQKDMNNLFLKVVKSKGYNYTYNPKLQYDYQAKRYTYTYPLGIFFYTKPFHKEFATGMLIALLSGSKAINDLGNYHEYYIEVMPSLDDIMMALYVK